jgi:hypothetical protein
VLYWLYQPFPGCKKALLDPGRFLTFWTKDQKGPFMSSHIDQYYKLNEQGRAIVMKAARDGDNYTTRVILKQFFPRLSASQLSTLLSQIRGLS